MNTEIDVSVSVPKLLREATSSELKAAQKYCSTLAKKEAGNFYYAFVFMQEEKRAGIEALYAFCRIGDDAVDDVELGGKGVISSFRRRLDICFEGKYRDKLTLALAWAVRQFDFERRHFDELLLGIESDLTIKRYQTFDELRLYCYRVASTVGLLCLKIFGCDTHESRLYAENLGIGMQLTNIMRDIKEDYDRDRIYFPLEDLAKFEIEEKELFLPANQQKLKKLVIWEAERAEQFFRKADNLMSLEMKRHLFPARIMGSIYREIHSKIVLSDSFDERIELSKWSKLRIARAILREEIRK